MEQKTILDVLHKLQEADALTLGIYVPGNAQSKLVKARELQREVINILRKESGDQHEHATLVQL